MNLNQEIKCEFHPVYEHVQNTLEAVDASGGAMIIIHNDKIAAENYWGTYTQGAEAKPIQEHSQFHVASVRKSYIALVAAYAVYYNYIISIDDKVMNYLPALSSDLFENVTIRHLLTHTHGLKDMYGNIVREFPTGEGWAYRGIGVRLLTDIIQKTTGKTISEIVTELAFEPLNFKETGWYGGKEPNLVKVLRDHNDPFYYWSHSTDGDKVNMYVSARELAYWGYLHLKEGVINGKQIVPKEMITMATSLQSPPLANKDYPQHGFLWYVKGANSAKQSEIGEMVPQGSYQLLGYTGVALLVVPEHNLVAVRMTNRFGSPFGYNYLTDIRSFGDTIMSCVNKLDMQQAIR